MDGHKFDKLTRAFAAGTDRRTLLKIFGGATVAGVAGMTVARPLGVFAQGSVQPGGECTTDDDCAEGSCSSTGENQPGVCYCPDPDRPIIGCGCDSGDTNACEGRADLCCEGTCISPMASCLPQGCSELQTMCEDTNCCAEDTTCGANGWCNGCYSGTEDPCGPYNEAFGADYICCTYGDTRDGAVGYCVAQDECVVAPPNTGAGATADTSSWIAPAAAIGAAAAVMAYKGREKKSETEA